MTMSRSIAMVLGCMLGHAAVTAADAAAIPRHMLGRQSQNEGVSVLPAPKTVAIDGDLREWDWSGRIWCFADIGVRDRYAVETAAMWDAEALYVAAKWRDPTPMFSDVDPNHTPGDGWKSDALQLRLRTTDQTTWVTTWFFAAKRTPVMDISRWKDRDDNRKGLISTLLTGSDGDGRLGQGAGLAYRADPDGKGYVQEMRIPWTLLCANPPSVKAGDTFRLGFEFLWGDPSGGRSQPIHRYADNMQPGVTSREFFFTNWKAWGSTTLLDAGGLNPRRYVPDGGLVVGAKPVRAALPAQAARFTLVIEDQQGRRVRNLVADADPADYATGGQEAMRTVEVGWDCRDDRGRPVAPGTYAVRGLSHGGLSVGYQQCFYNPGTPAWPTVDGRGAWGADHHPPSGVAVGGETTVVSWTFAEGGSGIIGIASDGRKRWSQYRGAEVIAADAAYVYAFQSVGWYVAGMKADFLCRYALADGTPRPFTIAGKLRPLDLPLHEVLGLAQAVRVTGMAVAGDRLALALAQGEIVILDSADLAVRKRFPIANPGPLAWAADGALYVIADSRVQRIDPATGAARQLELVGLGTPAALAVDRDGVLLVADTGTDCQVKAFAADGSIAYTCGRRGGRPIRGAFDAQAMMRMSALAVDARGEIWVTEAWDFPRRVSVWKRDGSLARDYIGNTGYSGTGSYLHDQDPTRAYCGSVEMMLDPGKRTWSVTNILWVPDAVQGEGFPIETIQHFYPVPQRFTASVGGQAHEYLYQHRPGGIDVVYLEGATGWRPVAAIGLAGQLFGMVERGVVVREPIGPWAGLDAGDGCFWNDGNGDGIPQRDECTIVPAIAKTALGKRVEKPALSLNRGWGSRMTAELTFATLSSTGSCIVYRPTRIAADGAPIYGPEGMQVIAVGKAGSFDGNLDTLLCPEEGRLIVVGTNYGTSDKPILGVDLSSGAVRWSYPNRYAGVHGSHDAPMPRPGMVIGSLKICGSAQMGGDIGTVFLVRGNLGQDFLLTSDGLFVGALFMDTRFPGDALPVDERQLLGRPMETFSEGSEPFNGWFGRQSDGVVRQVCGIPGQAAMVQTITGLEGINRWTAPPITVDEAMIAQAVAEAQARQPTQPTAATARLVRCATPPPCDGSGTGWDALRAEVLQVRRQGQPDSAEVRLAWDARALYVRWDVRDASPWKNAGSDAGRLFKTGDCVDLCLRTNPAATGGQPVVGDLRVVIGSVGGEDMAVIMRPIEPGAVAEVGRTYTSPVGAKSFARVARMSGARVAVARLPTGYRVEATLPLAELGLAARPSLALRGDVGFISSDPQGVSNIARTCWSNRDTNLVSDLPLEAWLYPTSWGAWTLE